jgi:hypothetical protein
MNRQQLVVLIAVGLSLFSCSCTLMQQPVAVAPVGPGPVRHPALTSTGFLKVYTEVECYPYDEDMYYFAHTDYGVYRPDGQRIKSVQNAASFHSLAPKQVELPPGQYEVVGWTDAYQLVKVPVLIKAGCLTTVNLEKDAHQLFQNAKQDDLVRTADGRIVGWSANVTAMH